MVVDFFNFFNFLWYLFIYIICMNMYIGWLICVKILFNRIKIKSYMYVYIFENIDFKYVLLSLSYFFCI